MRKVRCQLPGDGSQGICEACRINQRQCLFSLKNKTGRPRKTGPKSNAGDGRFSSYRSSGFCKSPNSPVQDDIMDPLSFQQLVTHAQDVSNQDTSPHTLPEHIQANDYFAIMSRYTQSQLPISQLAADVSLNRSDKALDQGPSLFQNSDPYTENVIREILKPTFAHSTVTPMHGPSSQFDSPMPGSMSTEGSETLSSGLSDKGRGSRGDAESTVSSAGDGVNSFSGVMQLCSDVHQRCKTRPLNMLSEADQTELASFFQTIHNLCHKVMAVMSQPDTAQSRQHQYQCTLLFVAVKEAVEIAAELVHFNLKLLGGYDNGSQHSPSRGFETWPCADGHMAGVTIKPTASAIEGILSLCRMDHALLHFGFFISSQNNDQRTHSDECPRAVSDSDVLNSCHCAGLTRVEYVKSQVWALVERLRSL